ncbi:MAG: hypothetical protein WCA00_01670 [Candidatus Acidiferrales bacterium]
MNMIRKSITLLGSITVLALLLAALLPRAARGVAAALVQVTNTASNAVPVVNSPGNFPFMATACVAFIGETCPPGFDSAFSVPLTTSTGLPVKRLVIEEVSGLCQIASNVSIDVAVYIQNPADYVTAGNSPVFIFIPSLDLPGGGNFLSAVRIYADPGTDVFTELHGARTGGIISPTECNLTLMGHLETP